MPTITTGDGVELHYQLDDFRDPWISDQGDTILMSHGLSRSMKWWTPVGARALPEVQSAEV